MWFLRKKIDNGKWDEMNKEVMRLTKENRLDEAFALGKELFKYTRKSYGKKHRKTVTSLNNLGTICTLKKEFDEAESYLLLALQISEKTSGRFSKEAAVVNMNLARLYTAKAKEINDIVSAFEEKD